MPKQSQSQRQSVVVNVGTSKTKSKPRKSRGRGGLPPPSYQHNLAPTFVTQQATDYTPIIGAIASLTAKLNEQPRIQQPVTPLSSTTSFSTQQAQAMAGQMAEERRTGPTADSFVPHASQVRTATVDFVMPREEIGTNRPPTRVVPGELIREPDEYIRPPDEYFTERLVKSKENFQRLPSASAQSSLKMSSDEYQSPIVLESDSSSVSSLNVSSDSEGPAAGGGGAPRVFKTPPKVLAKARQQAQERKAKLDSIREKMKEKQQITTEERQFVMKSKGAKKLQKSLELMNRVGPPEYVGSTRKKIKRDKKISIELVEDV
jgi:hypothetical protein